MSRFEDNTFESIREQMLTDVHADMGIDAQEGSLISNAIALIANRLEEAYADLDSVNDNLLVDTMDREHLIESGAEVGLPVDEGDYAVLTGYLNIPVELGTEFSATDYDFNFVVIESLGPVTVNDELYYSYNFECDDVGTEPNTFTGDIEPVEAIDGFETGVITACVVEGVDEEDTELYRARRLDYFTEKAFAGNKKYYEDEIKDIDGVGALKIARREKDDEYINIYILNSALSPAPADLVETVQNIVDPDEGQGDGIAPIGHKVLIHSANSVNLAIAATIEYDDGYSYEDLKTQLEEACKKYVLSLREAWEESTQLIVRLSGIESHILNVQGVLDISNVTINGQAENIRLEEYDVPVFASYTEA